MFRKIDAKNIEKKKPIQNNNNKKLQQISRMIKTIELYFPLFSSSKDSGLLTVQNLEHTNCLKLLKFYQKRFLIWGLKNYGEGACTFNPYLNVPQE